MRAFIKAGIHRSLFGILLAVLPLAGFSQSQSLTSKWLRADTAEIMSFLKGLSGTTIGGAENEYAEDLDNIFAASKERKFNKGCASALYVKAILYYRSAKFAEAATYFEKSVVFRDEDKDLSYIAKTKKNIGLCKKELGEFDAALRYFTIADSLARILRDSVFIAQNYESVGQIYENTGKIDLAQEYYIKSLRIHQKKNNSEGIANSYNNIGNSFFYTKDFQKSLQYYNLSLQVAKKAALNSLIAKSLANTGMAYGEMKDYPRALSQYLEAEKYFLELKNPFNLGTLYNNIATIYDDKGNYDSSIYFQKKSLELKRVTNDAPGIATGMINLANSYFHKGDVQKCLPLFAEGVLLARKLNAAQIELNGLKNYAAALQRSGNYSKAIDAFLRYDSLNISLNSAAKAAYINELEKKYNEELAKKELYEKDKSLQLALNKNLKQELESRKKSGIIVIISFALLVVCVTIILVLILSRKRKRQNELLRNLNIQVSTKNEQNELLLGEIHHRVKNNLQIVSSLLSLQQKDKSNSAEVKDAVAESKQRIQSMSIIHKLLYQESHFSEVDVKKYLTDLTKEHEILFNLQNKLTVHLPEKSYFLNIDLAVPLGLILNELILNAMKYAFMEHPNPTLTIQMEQQNDNVVVILEDNGKGFDEKLLMQPNATFGGRLIHSLLRQINGELIVNSSEKGTKFTLKIKNEHGN